LTYEDCCKFIELAVAKTPHGEKYFIDMSGSGEPLLKIGLVYRIADYCEMLSNRIGKEVIPSLVTNGSLLSRPIVEGLQTHKVLFGISFDGVPEQQNRNRRLSGKGSSSIVLSNISEIKNMNYVGGAMTICDNKDDIFASYLQMIKIFPTVSIRIARGGQIFRDGIAHILEGYEQFTEYIVNQALEKSNLKPLFSIMNGDDYFGRYILKIFYNAFSYRRCDAGIARFSLGTDKRIYICSACVGNQRLSIGDLQNGFDDFWYKTHPTKCGKCKECNISSLCGGECHVLSIQGINEEEIYCNYRKKLFVLALYVRGQLEIKRPVLFNEVLRFCEEIVRRNFADPILTDLQKFYKSKYTFVQLKDIKDHNPPLYKKLVNKMQRS